MELLFSQHPGDIVLQQKSIITKRKLSSMKKFHQVFYLHSPLKDLTALPAICGSFSGLFSLQRIVIFIWMITYQA
jgi:hypothetical protein